MKNPSAFPPPAEQFNDFTRYLRRVLKHQTTVPVKLRDGKIVEIYWFTEDGPEYQGFASDIGGHFRWENNGLSITSTDFDIVEDMP